MVARSSSRVFVRIGVFLIFSVFAPSASACVVELPDCNLFPEHPFCTPVVNPAPDPIVLVPGIVASYNRRVLFKDKSGGGWDFVPFGNIYKGLIHRMELAGYEYGENFFIAFYDWRHSNAQSADEYLAPIIAEAKEHSESGKVDIVAHSMGGLLTQEYITSDQYMPGEIDQFIMLGTPNAGASDAYLPWEGGVLPASWDNATKWYINTIEDSLKSIKKFTFDSPKSYRHFFPSLKELLPTNSFVTKDGELVSRESLTEQNSFLEVLQEYQDTLLNTTGITVTSIIGTEQATLDTIALSGSRTADDIDLDRWRDGHPVAENLLPSSLSGDQTVLESSASIGTNTIVMPGISHTALPEHAQDEVLAALGVVDNHSPQFIYQEPYWLTGFVVLSPVDIVITDSTGKTVSKDVNDYGENAFVDISEGEEDDPKIIIVQNLPPGTYTVHLTGTDTGPYTVIATHTDDETSESKTLTGTTTLGKEESFTITIGDDTGMQVSEITNDTPEPGALVIPSAVSGKGDEQDCCPGKDVITKNVGKGKILGVSTKKTKRGTVTLEELKPLNDIFFSVYGRMPTFNEWKYWVNRYSGDKRDFEKLRGAMSWHKARGLNPV